MPSIQARLIKRLFHLKPQFWTGGSIHDQRTRQATLIRNYQLSWGIRFDPIENEAFQAAWVNGRRTGDGVVLYLHGGAYALGSIDTHREYLGRFASAVRAKVLALNYRLAPEHPFPAALEDVICAYDWLLAQGFDPQRIALAGDSAGGGLCISTLIALRDAGRPMPACAVCISPWIDLTLSSDSVYAKAGADPVLSASLLAPFADYYAGDHPKDDPLISPLFADLAGLPPLMIHVGTDEILLDEARQLTSKAGSAGVTAVLYTWEGMFHVFQMVPVLPESRKSLRLIADFISQNLNGGN